LMTEDQVEAVSGMAGGRLTATRGRGGRPHPSRFTRYSSLRDLTENCLSPRTLTVGLGGENAVGAELVVNDSALIAQLDAWPDSAVVCDPDGRILFVNRAWRRFAAANGYDGADFVGYNYFAVCAESEGVERRDSDAVTVGLRRVAAGAAEAFTYRYPCHAPHQKRWFKLVATAHNGFDGARIVIVYHLNITEEVEVPP